MKNTQKLLDEIEQLKIQLQNSKLREGLLQDELRQIKDALFLANLKTKNPTLKL
jgi:hypothetical protein